MHVTDDLDIVTGIDASNMSGDVDLNSQILLKLISLIENQAVLIAAIIERLDKSNILLKEISNSISSISKSDD